MSDGGLVCCDGDAGVVEAGDVAEVDGISGVKLMAEGISGLVVVVDGSEDGEMPFETDANEGAV